LEELSKIDKEKLKNALAPMRELEELIKNKFQLNSIFLVMLEWIKNINKELPFWKTYLAKFDKKSNRYVVISTETTGMNPEKDVILSIVRCR
jgi:hypothetical protein